MIFEIRGTDWNRWGRLGPDTQPPCSSETRDGGNIFRTPWGQIGIDGTDWDHTLIPMKVGRNLKIIANIYMEEIKES